nr:MAG TPA: hypothetical protein [Siphoviridae sp. ctdzB12]
MNRKLSKTVIMLRWRRVSLPTRQVQHFIVRHIKASR